MCLPQEIKGQSAEVEFLSTEYQDVLENAEKCVRTCCCVRVLVAVAVSIAVLACGQLWRRVCALCDAFMCGWLCCAVLCCRYQKEMKTQPKALEMLFGLVTDLFVDKHKFKGHNVRAWVCFADSCRMLTGSIIRVTWMFTVGALCVLLPVSGLCVS